MSERSSEKFKSIFISTGESSPSSNTKKNSDVNKVYTSIPARKYIPKPPPLFEGSGISMRKSKKN